MGLALRKFEEKESVVTETAVDSKELMNAQNEKTRLKEFGVLMAAVLTGISALLLFKERSNFIYTLSGALFFLIPAYLSPLLLKPIERVWLAFGEKMSIVVTTILLIITFYLVMTPIGLLLKLLGKDLLDQKLEPEAKSYWKKVEQDGPSSRPYLPY